jgi:hypothetical protein
MYFQTGSCYYLDDLDNLDDPDIIQQTELIPKNNITSDEDTSDNTNNENVTNDCLICLEITDKSDSICIKLRNDIFTKECLCDGWIHYCCLDAWYTSNNKCPICLIVMRKMEIKELNEIPELPELPEYDVTTNTIQTIFTCQSTKGILRICLLCIMFYNITFIIYKILTVIV